MSSWRSPNVSKMVLAAFAEKGLVPPKEVAHWRVPYVAGFITVCEAFIRMEPYVDSFRRVLMLGTEPVGGFTLAATQVGQFINFGEISSSHGSHTLAGIVPA